MDEIVKFESFKFFEINMSSDRVFVGFQMVYNLLKSDQQIKSYGLSKYCSLSPTVYACVQVHEGQR